MKKKQHFGAARAKKALALVLFPAKTHPFWALGCLEPKMPERLNNKNWLEKELLGAVFIIFRAWSIQSDLIN
jgi:hypothetical protein